MLEKGGQSRCLLRRQQNARCLYLAEITQETYNMGLVFK
jgi:hypothetical protein